MRIDPIDDALFSMDVLHEAVDLARDNPAQLSVRHLQHVAVYDKALAMTYLDKRDRAIIAAQTKALEPPARPAAAAVPGVSRADLQTALTSYTEGIAKALKDALKQRDDRIAALEAENKTLAARIATLEAPLAASTRELLGLHTRHLHQ